jgi:hypothetical protein
VGGVGASAGRPPRGARHAAPPPLPSAREHRLVVVDDVGQFLLHRRRRVRARARGVEELVGQIVRHAHGGVRLGDRAVAKLKRRLFRVPLGGGEGGWGGRSRRAAARAARAPPVPLSLASCLDAPERVLFVLDRAHVLDAAPVDRRGEDVKLGGELGVEGLRRKEVCRREAKLVVLHGQIPRGVAQLGHQGRALLVQVGKEAGRGRGGGQVEGRGLGDGVRLDQEVAKVGPGHDDLQQLVAEAGAPDGEGRASVVGLGGGGGGEGRPASHPACAARPSSSLPPPTSTAQLYSLVAAATYGSSR